MQSNESTGRQGAPRPVWLAQIRTTGRATTARLLTLQVLEEAQEHVTVAEIHEQLRHHKPHVSLSTVYRTMDRLMSLQLVHRLDMPGDARYGTLGREHHHAVCTECGRVIELKPALVAQTLDEIGGAIGMVPDPVAGLMVRGTCRSCRQIKTPDARH